MADMVSRVYSNFRGVDFRGEEVNLTRSPDALNVYKDYKETESIRTRPGTELHKSLTEAVYGIFFYKGSMLVHSGNALHKITGDTTEKLYEGLKEGISNAFVFEDIWYFKDGKHYLQYDGETISDVVGYIPTTTIARKPMGGGTKYEDVNMLSDYRKNSFLADGGSFDFFLDVFNIDTDFVPEVTYNDELVATSDYTVDYAEGKITFNTYAPDSPLTDGQDNVVVKFKKAVVDENGKKKYHKCILECNLLQVFDNRVFFSGNDEFPNYVWNCSLNDPTYVSDLDYYKEGMDQAKVKGMVAGNNALWVFREPSDANTTVFYHTPTLDEEYGKIYPSSHSSVTTGCVGKAINFNDDIVFFSERGMEGISGDVTTEQVVAHRSSMVDRKMTAEPGYTDMVLEEWNGYLMVFIGTKVYLADSRAMLTYENHSEYEWFYWDIGHTVLCTKVKDGVLYLGTEDGIYTLTDYDGDVASYWTTPLDKFKYPHKMKTTSKKSCTIEAKGEVIYVFAKTNRDESFELLGTYGDVVDAISCRIKKKKFKDLQLKFQSPKRFALETATLDCYIGGYLKNL